MPASVLVALRVRAGPQRAFDVFTQQIDSWWRRNPLFEFVPGRSGKLAFASGVGGRLVERFDDGTEYEIGRIELWQPPERLIFKWRPASFAAAQATEVHVSFEPVGEETRITVQHFGWDAVPREHVARHGFPEQVFMLRLAEWWRALLGSLGQRASTLQS
jgi:hypothetical protein